MGRGLGKTQREVLAAVYSLTERGWVCGRFDPGKRLAYYRASTPKIIQEVVGFTNKDVRRRPRGWKGAGYWRWDDDCLSTELAIAAGCVTRSQVGAIKRALLTLVHRGLLVRCGRESYTTPEEYQRHNTPEMQAERAARFRSLVAAGRG